MSESAPSKQRLLHIAQQLSQATNRGIVYTMDVWSLQCELREIAEALPSETTGIDANAMLKRFAQQEAGCRLCGHPHNLPPCPDDDRSKPIPPEEPDALTPSQLGQAIADTCALVPLPHPPGCECGLCLPEKAGCALCGEGMTPFAAPATGNRMHARNGVVT